MFLLRKTPDFGKELWISDGTASGTIELSDTPFYPPDKETLIDGDYIFQGGGGIWKTNGTPAGTQLISDEGNSIEKITQFGDQVIYSNFHSLFQTEPWITDGTAAGTHLIKDIDPDGTSNPDDFMALEDYMWFIARENSDDEIWLTNGEESGTFKRDLPGEVLERPDMLTFYQGKIFFVANSDIYGREIFYLDLLPEKIKGQVYHDENENGQKDPNEEGIYNRAIIADNGEEILTFSDIEGNYSFFVEEGAYEISMLEDQCWELTSDSSSYQINAGEEVITGLDFGFKKDSDLESVDIQLFAGPTAVDLQYLTGSIFIIMSAIR